MIIKSRSYFFLLLPLCFLVSCVPANSLQHKMVRHSTSLYAYRYNPSDKTYNSHKALLLKIISESELTNERIPPGICAEYGYLMSKEGKGKEAVRYYRLEKSIYPESMVLMDRLIQAEGRSSSER